MTYVSQEGPQHTAEYV